MTILGFGMGWLIALVVVVAALVVVVAVLVPSGGATATRHYGAGCERTRRLTDPRPHFATIVQVPEAM
jgi:hypothetical protein